MRIKIAERLRPFSHTPGVSCVLPYTLLKIQVFPTKVFFFDEQNAKIAELTLEIEGPLKGFTVQQDLEKGEVCIWGKAKTGFLRYRILPTGKLCSLVLEKSPPNFKWSCTSDEIVVNPAKIKERDSIEERLSLGSHKAQDFDAIRRRLDLVEIFPFWLRLGLMLPEQEISTNEGTLSLLKTCSDKREVVPAFQNVFQAGFSGILSPRLTDEEYQGFQLPKTTHTFVPFALLTEGAKLIRSLFVQVQGNEIALFPLLPPEFHSGRYLNIPLGDLGTMDLEWSKKKIRRVIFRAKKRAKLKFPKGIKTCRLRLLTKERGKKITCLETDAAKSYYLDRFEK